MKLPAGRTSRIALGIAAALCLVAVLGLISAALIVRTGWFKNKVKENTIAAIERTTGGRVDLGTFDFDWSTLTANFDQLTVHGTEPASGPPLFHTDSIRLSLRIVSLLERNIDVAAVAIQRSETYLLVRSDGSTNIPGPPQHPENIGDVARDLLKLKIGHFEFRNATLQTDLKRILLNARGEGLRISLAYKTRPSRYGVVLSSSELSIDSPQINTFSGKLELQAQLKRDEIILENAALESGGSAVYLKGAVRRLNDPIVDIQLTSTLRAQDVAQRLNFAGLTGGQIRVDGSIHYDRFTSAAFKGRVEGKSLACRLPGFSLNNANLRFNAEGKQDKIWFGDITVSDAGKRVGGAATLTNLNTFAFDGRVASLGTTDVFREFRSVNVPYSGTLSGPLQLTGKLRKGLRNITVHTNLQISPGTEGIPISGDVNASYIQQSQTVEFGDSHLDSANSHVFLSGSPGATLRVKLSSTDLSELRPALQALHGKTIPSNFDLRRARVAFDGQITGKLSNPEIAGDLSMERFQINGTPWDQLRSQVVASAGSLIFHSLSASQGTFHIVANGSVGLNSWTIRPDSEVRVQASLKDAELSRLGSSFHGLGSGSLTLAGTFSMPRGQGLLTISDLDVYGEHLNEVKFGASLNSDTLTVTGGRAQARGAVISFSGTYGKEREDWARGNLQMRIDSNGFPLTAFSSARKLLPKLDARLEIHANIRARLAANHIEPENADGTLILKRITIDGAPFGDMTVNAATHGNQLSLGVAGNLEGSPVSGNLRAQLVDLDPATGEFHFGRISLATMYGLARSGEGSLSLPHGFVEGWLSFNGPLLRPSQMNLRLGITDLEMNPAAREDRAASLARAIHNVGPILIDARGSTATIRSFQLRTPDTHLNVAGSFSYGGQRALNLQIDGSADFRLFEIFDPNIQSGGLSVLKVSVGGTVEHPSVDGTMELHGGSLFANNLTNGLSKVDGIVRFNRDRATIQTLTAQTGGGELAFTGFVSFGTPGGIIYNVQASATNVRVRYTGASVSADGLLQLTGSSRNGLLSGRVTVSRIIISQNADLGNVLASTVAAASPPGNERDLINGLLLDLRIQSGPNLRLSTDLSQDVEADIDLRVRGTAMHPILLGSISANQGELNVFGAKYRINRGDVTFVNTVKIEPVLDLDLQTETRGITVDITISGTLNKLNMNYRSDPPLQPKDIIALLTLGQAPSATANPSNIKANSDVSALQAGANTVLGQAISPASNRLSKLFGITNIKIDPLVQGITNTPQARLTLEQQISRDITVTYVTNLAQTSEQIFRFEWALNRQFSVVAVRDDNGEFGIDFQYKKRFR